MYICIYIYTLTYTYINLPKQKKQIYCPFFSFFLIDIKMETKIEDFINKLRLNLLQIENIHNPQKRSFLDGKVPIHFMTKDFQIPDYPKSEENIEIHMSAYSNSFEHIKTFYKKIIFFIEEKNKITLQSISSFVILFKQSCSNFMSSSSNKKILPFLKQSKKYFNEPEINSEFLKKEDFLLLLIFFHNVDELSLELLESIEKMLNYQKMDINDSLLKKTTTDANFSYINGSDYISFLPNSFLLKDELIKIGETVNKIFNYDKNTLLSLFFYKDLKINKLKGINNNSLKSQDILENISILILKRYIEIVKETFVLLFTKNKINNVDWLFFMNESNENDIIGPYPLEFYSNERYTDDNKRKLGYIFNINGDEINESFNFLSKPLKDSMIIDDNMEFHNFLDSLLDEILFFKKWITFILDEPKGYLSQIDSGDFIDYNFELKINDDDDDTNNRIRFKSRLKKNSDVEETSFQDLIETANLKKTKYQYIDKLNNMRDVYLCNSSYAKNVNGKVITKTFFLYKNDRDQYISIGNIEKTKSSYDFKTFGKLNDYNNEISFMLMCSSFIQNILNIGTLYKTFNDDINIIKSFYLMFLESCIDEHSFLNNNISSSFITDNNNKILNNNYFNYTLNNSYFNIEENKYLNITPGGIVYEWKEICERETDYFIAMNKIIDEHTYIFYNIYTLYLDYDKFIVNSTNNMNLFLSSIIKNDVSFSSKYNNTNDDSIYKRKKIDYYENPSMNIMILKMDVISKLIDKYWKKKFMVKKIYLFDDNNKDDNKDNIIFSDEEKMSIDFHSIYKGELTNNIFVKNNTSSFKRLPYYLLHKKISIFCYIDNETNNINDLFNNFNLCIINDKIIDINYDEDDNEELSETFSNNNRDNILCKECENLLIYFEKLYDLILQFILNYRNNFFNNNDTLFIKIEKIKRYNISLNDLKNKFISIIKTSRIFDIIIKELINNNGVNYDDNIGDNISDIELFFRNFINIFKNDENYKYLIKNVSFENDKLFIHKNYMTAIYNKIVLEYYKNNDNNDNKLNSMKNHLRLILLIIKKAKIEDKYITKIKYQNQIANINSNYIFSNKDNVDNERYYDILKEIDYEEFDESFYSKKYDIKYDDELENEFINFLLLFLFSKIHIEQKYFYICDSKNGNIGNFNEKKNNIINIADTKKKFFKKTNINNITPIFHLFLNKTKIFEFSKNIKNNNNNENNLSLLSSSSTTEQITNKYYYNNEKINIINDFIFIVYKKYIYDIKNSPVYSLSPYPQIYSSNTKRKTPLSQNDIENINISTEYNNLSRNDKSTLFFTDPIQMISNSIGKINF